MNFTKNLFINGIRLLSSNMPQLTGRSFHSMLRPTFQNGIPTAVASGPPFEGLTTPLNLLLTQTCGFKVKAKLRRRCKDCYIVVRHQRHYVICPTHPRHKQMSMKKRDYKSWILTHATQSKVRPY